MYYIPGINYTVMKDIFNYTRFMVIEGLLLSLIGVLMIGSIGVFEFLFYLGGSLIISIPMIIVHYKYRRIDELFRYSLRDPKNKQIFDDYKGFGSWVALGAIGLLTVLILKYNLFIKYLVFFIGIIFPGYFLMKLKLNLMKDLMQDQVKKLIKI